MLDGVFAGGKRGSSFDVSAGIILQRELHLNRGALSVNLAAGGAATATRGVYGESAVLHKAKYLVVQG